jgi:GTP 3',8-cyclase
MNNYHIDSHKLHFHVEQVSDWKKGKDVYPIYMEISPSGACNHRCVFCALDYMGYQKRYLDIDVLKVLLSELGQLGLKSIMFGGEGEPFLHRHMKEIIVHAKGSGIDVAVTTNGVLMHPSIAEEVMPHTEWIKVSIGAATPGTYSKIHRTKASDFDKVIANMAAAVEIRKKHGYACTLGMQILLLPENSREVIALAELARSIDIDYLVVKPYSQHTHSKTDCYSEVRYGQYQHFCEELSKFNNDNFQVIFREHTMEKWDQGKKDYQVCLAQPFWSYIDAGGGVWGCSAHLSDERFYYGNIYEKAFGEIWKSEKRKKSLKWIANEFSVNDCRVNCRMDEINRYLWQLKNPPSHVNFI